MKNPYAPPLDHQYKSFLENIGAAFDIFIYYVKILFYPVDLTLDYSAHYPNVIVLKRSVLNAIVIMSLITISFYTAFLSRHKKDLPVKSVCIMLFFFISFTCR